MSFINVVDGFLPGVFEKIASPFLDVLMVALSCLGDGGILWIILISVLLMTKKYRQLGVVAAVSLCVCFLSGNFMIKPIVARVRPCNIDPALRMLIERPDDFSFPSMHTATAFSVAWVIFSENKIWGSAAIILSVLIAVSRVYLNVHYTTDIICGAIYGILVAFVVKFVIKKTKFNRLDY